MYLVNLSPVTGELDDKKKELNNMVLELRETLSDKYIRPAQVLRKLKDIKENIVHCHDEYNELARNIRRNYA